MKNDKPSSGALSAAKRIVFEGMTIPLDGGVVIKLQYEMAQIIDEEFKVKEFGGRLHEKYLNKGRK